MEFPNRRNWHGRMRTLFLLGTVIIRPAYLEYHESPMAAPIARSTQQLLVTGLSMNNPGLRINK